ncbi:MAG: hypothetical protein M1829_005001 [Trizodia sp. TS-e1964]|nr:MAG: hypothetical protein M1829_005001 [Trizodia sp. TS-e1964]
MHRVRSSARRHACIRKEGDASYYNPFARSQSKSKVNDIEGGRLSDAARMDGVGTSHTNHSITCLENGTQQPKNPDAENQGFGGPLHAQTLPPSSPSSQHQHASASSEETVIDKETAAPAASPAMEAAVRNRKGGEESPEKIVEEEDFKPVRKFTVMSQFKATLLNSPINMLLVAAPVGIILHYLNVKPVAVFVVNFIAIIPLAAMLSYATEEIALRVGETLGGLINATFGNAVELIVSIIALVHGQVLIVKTSLVGSILSNLLLVMGMCFFFGGLRRSKQHFNVTVAQTASSLLALSVGSLIIPTAYENWSKGSLDNLQLSARFLSTNRVAIVVNHSLVEVSRGTAIILLVVYGCYLFFQLGTHIDLYNKPSKKVAKRPSKHRVRGAFKRGRKSVETMEEEPCAEDSSVVTVEEHHEPELSITTAMLTLLISTVLVAFCAEFMVDSIDALTASSGISKTFVGLILLPIVGNAAEHATAVTVACKDKMDLAIGVAVGSSMQIALLVIPFTVTLGWIVQNPDMTLSFDGFQIAVLFVAVLLVNYLIQDGESHWLEGVLLMTLYLIVSLAAWFYTDPPNDSQSGG